MAEVNIGVAARDLGAKRLIADLVKALVGLSKAGKDAAGNRAGIEASKETIRVLREQLAIAKQYLLNRQQEVDALRKLGEQQITDAKRLTSELIAEARRKASEEQSSAQKSQQIAQARAQAAREAVAAEVQSQRETVRAVQSAVSERIAAERTALAASIAAAQARVVFERQRLQKLVETRNREREIARERIAEARASFQQAKDIRDVASTGPARQAAQVNVKQRQDELRLLKDQEAVEDDRRRKSIQSQREILESAKTVARERIKTNNEALRSAIETGKAEIAQAKLTAREAIQTAKQRAQARLEEARQAGRSTRDVIAAGREEIAQARQQGRETVASARRQRQANIENANTALRTSRQRVNQLRTEARETQRSAREQERALNRANAALRRQGSTVPGLDAGLRRLRSTVVRLVAAYAGFRAIEGFIATGLRFNQMIESSRLGIASLITASSDLVDANGRLLGGTEALAAAQGLAQKQLDKLRVAGIQTSATTEELIITFQEATAAGLAVGLSLDQIRKFSVSVAQAATAINLPMNQLQQEARSILQSTIDRNSRIAKALNLTNAEVNLAKQQGRLMDLLNEKFRAFNIAGVESVKTFSALKSNIQDAFAVFAGAATQPLFEDLRNAGQAALARIFDFDTAEIRENFKGLIEGLRTLFGQVGEVFSTAIRTAVDRAEELSKWITQNKEEVRKTAAAVATMVQEFGNMISAIVRGTAEMLSLGNQVNTVTGLARTLSAIFEAIADNVKLIIGLLAGKALFTAIRGIVAAVAVLRGAAIGTAVFPGIGTIIGTVVGLSAAYKLLKTNQQATKLETARLGNAMQDQHLKGVELIGTLINIEQALNQTARGSEEAAELTKRLNQVQDELRQLGPQYAAALGDGTLSLEERRQKLLEVAQAQKVFTAFQLANARAEQARLEAQREPLQKKVDEARKKPLAASPTYIEDKKRLDELTRSIEINGEKVRVTAEEYLNLTAAINRATEAPATIRARKPTEKGAGGEPIAIKQARAEFEAKKAELEAERTKIDVLFTARQISAEQNLNRLLDVDLAEIEAERKFLLAQRAEAERRIREEKAKPKGGKPRQFIDQQKALDISLAALGFKQIKVVEEFNANLIQNGQERADRLLEIEQRFLEASGQLHEAALLEIQRKTDKGLRDAIQEFGTQELRLAAAKIQPGDVEGLRQLLVDMEKTLPPVLVHLAFAIEQEQVREQVKAVEDQIRRAEDQRNRESEAIRARFQALGKLSNPERQQQLNELAAANQRAVAATEKLRAQLVKLREEAKSPDLVLEIDVAIARLDALKAKAVEVDVEMRKLREGSRQALESGLAGFFESIGSGSKSAGNAFREMVQNIINDMRRLVAEIIASQITRQLFGAIAGSAAGSAAGSSGAGNQTQSGPGAGQRATGGIAGRPPHGVLHGGVPGKDSIPISAMPEEYFVRREATKKYGADVLDLFNEMRVPVTWARELFSLLHSHFIPRTIRPRHSFASGGAVGRSSGNGARPVMRQEVLHTITLDQNGALTFLNGSAGKSIVLGHVGSAPRFVSQQVDRLKRKR